MALQENSPCKEVLKVSPAPSISSDRDALDDARKINNGKVMGDSDDENMSGFDSDSEDEAHQNANCKKKLRKFCDFQ